MKWGPIYGRWDNNEEVFPWSTIWLKSSLPNVSSLKSWKCQSKLKPSGMVYWTHEIKNHKHPHNVIKLPSHPSVQPSLYPFFFLKLLTHIKQGLQKYYRSSRGVVHKLLAVGARGSGFDYWCHRYDFRDWSSPASRSRYGCRSGGMDNFIFTTKAISISTSQKSRSIEVIFHLRRSIVLILCTIRPGLIIRWMF